MANYSKRGNWILWSFQPPKGWQNTYNQETTLAEHNGSNPEDNPDDWYVTLKRKTFAGAIRQHCKLYKQNGHCLTKDPYSEGGFLYCEDDTIWLDRNMWCNPEGARKHYQGIVNNYGDGFTVELCNKESFH